VTRRPRCLLLTGCLLAAVPLGAEPAMPEVLLSRQLMEDHGLRPGDVVQLSRDGDPARARPFRVAAGYEPTPDPMRFTAKRLEARLHLADMLALSADTRDPQARESVSAINVALNDADAEAVKRFTKDVQARLPNLAVLPTSGGGAADPFVVLERFHVAISVVTILGSTAFLLALMVMRAEERREIAGILRLLGFRRRRILLQVLLEGLLVAALGATFGVAFALLLEDVVNAFFQWRYDTALVFVRVTSEIALRCVAIAAPLGMLAGLVASFTLLRRDVGELVRR
jgi:hypothetical protein